MNQQHPVHKQCANCGSTVAAHAKYCAKCGAKVDTVAAVHQVGKQVVATSGPNKKLVMWGWVLVLMVPFAVVAFAIVQFIVNVASKAGTDPSSTFGPSGVFAVIFNTLIFLIGAVGVIGLPIGIILLVRGYSSKGSQVVQRTVAPGEPAPRGWNWGAFILPPIWGIGNNVWIGLLGFIPLVNFVMAIYLGAKGNELAWNARQWDSAEHFRSVQKKWAIWGLVLASIYLVLQLLAAAGGQQS
jgi:hypothetical protein